MNVPEWHFDSYLADLASMPRELIVAWLATVVPPCHRFGLGFWLSIVTRPDKALPLFKTFVSR